MKTSNPGANHAVLQAQNDRRDSDLITLFCMHKTTGEVWEAWRLVILVLITLFCMHKAIGEVWDPWRLVILVLITLFACTKRQVRSGTHRDY